MSSRRRLFNEIAAVRGLAVRAIARGTDPESVGMRARVEQLVRELAERR